MKYQIMIKLIYDNGTERILETEHLFDNFVETDEAKQSITKFVESAFHEGKNGYSTIPMADGYTETINLSMVAGLALKIVEVES